MKELTIKYGEYQQRGVRNAFEYFEKKLTEAGFDLKLPIVWSPFDFLCDITFTQPDGGVEVVQADLALVPVDALIEELGKRHDAVIFSGMKKLDDKGAYSRAARWKGNFNSCLAMAEILRTQIVQAMLQREQGKA